MKTAGTGIKRVAIVDDEPAAIASLRSVLDDFDAIEIVAEVKDGVHAIEAIRHHRPDIVFLDIEMPGVNGFEVASKTAHLLHQLVFVTAYDQYALDAFGTHAIDYLLKPVRPSVLRKCIEKILHQEDVVAEVLHKQELPRNNLVLSDGSDVKVLSQAHICLIEGLGRYRRIHLTQSGLALHGTQTIVSDVTLDDLNAQLSDSHFIRLHRSYIVCLQQIIELYLESRRHFVKLAEVDFKVPVSRSKVATLKSRIH